MNRFLIIIIISLFIVSCSSSEDGKSSTEKLESYKEQVKELNKKITAIKKEISKGVYTGIAIPVKVETVISQPFFHNFTATGELESIDDAFISPEVNGQIISVNVQEGEYVKKGQLLAKLNTTIIENSISEVKTQLDLAKTIYDKQSVLWDKNIGSERQFLEVKNNFDNLTNRLNTLNAQYDMAIIKSPIDGIVEDIFLKKGELASPGMQFMQIVNIDELYVTLKLSEAYLPIIKKGDIVDISFPSFPAIKLSEPVYRTGNIINKQDRTFVVKIKINNKNGELKPYLLANVLINDYNTNKAIVLPSIIIKEDAKGSFIFEIKNDNGDKIASKKYINSGISYKDKTEITSGLKPGDIIITDGYNTVSNGSVVTIVD
ncbi:MAG: efflux RND transporter periplasmic adaptor subunit [Bacteroidota bacterium]